LRRSTILVTLIILVFAHSPHQVTATSGPCCEYTFIVSDSQPKPGERVDFTGVVTDQFGGGEPNVTVQYQDTAVRNGNGLSNSTTDANGAFHLSTTMPVTENPNPIRFTLIMNDPNGGGSQTAVGTYPATRTSPSGDVPALYNSQLGGRTDAYLNIQSLGSPAVMYISNGYDEPILHGVSSLDQGTTDLLTGLANKGFNVIAPIAWFAEDFPFFPFELAAMLKYGFHVSQVYIIGWSAGGTVAAWNLTHDLYGLFNLGVVMDAELIGATNQTQTDPSVFKTAQSPESVKIPYLLIWGVNEGGSTSIQSAMLWARRAQNNLVRLDPFAYSHQWIGTDVEDKILADILAFFNTQTTGTLSLLQSNSGNTQILTDSQVLTNNPYDSLRREYALNITGQNDTIGSMNLAIPISSIDGQPVVLFDRNAISAAYSSDATNYYIYFTYTHSTHTILVVGQNDIPEFVANPSIVAAALLLCMLIMIASRKRSRPT